MVAGVPFNHAGISLVSGPWLPFTAQDVQSGCTLLSGLGTHEAKATPICDEQMSCGALKPGHDQQAHEALLSQREKRFPLTAVFLKS